MGEEAIKKQEQLVSLLDNRWSSLVSEADKMWEAWVKKDEELNGVWEQRLVESRRLETMKEGKVRGG